MQGRPGSGPGGSRRTPGPRLGQDGAVTTPVFVQRALGAVPGAALAVGAVVTARIRHTKPLHPVGIMGAGRLHIEGGAATGVPLLDEPAEHDVIVRWSRAMGLPPGAADIEGLALRLDLGGVVADVLFASTGDGVISRHALVARRPGQHGCLTTLLPVSTPGGSLLLRLVPSAGPTASGLPVSYELSVGHVGGPWRTVGQLTVDWREEDQKIRFDPVLNQLPGTTQYGWVTTLREPAYRAGRSGAP